jgi:NAD(P)-dependent dehydrogenase (short-subunit alcohol dehydrogenase family)
MTVYAVTGASGHLGRLAVQQLLARGVLPSDIVAVVRSRATVADFVARGVQAREADYSEPDTLRAALAGVTRLPLVSSSEAGQHVVHHTNVINAAKAVRVSRILYTSMLNTDVATNPFSADHLASRARASRERRGVHSAVQWPPHGGLHRPFARIRHQWGRFWARLLAAESRRPRARTSPRRPWQHSFATKVETRRTSLAAHRSISPSSGVPSATSSARG